MQQPLPPDQVRICQSCGIPAATKRVHFHQNIGMLVMRRHAQVQGELCRACVDRFFWNMTGKTMLLGWWGVISFIVTPFIILNNTFHFIASRSVPRPPLQLQPGPSPFWVFTTIAGFAAVALLLADIALGMVRPTPAPQEECALQLRGYAAYMILNDNGAKDMCSYALSRHPDTFTSAYNPPRSPVICSEDIDGMHATIVDTSSAASGGTILCRSLYEALK